MAHITRRSLQLDSQWKMYFKDTSQRLDSLQAKCNPGSPDLRHIHLMDALFVDDFSPSWVKEELNRQGIRFLFKERVAVNEDNDTESIVKRYVDYDEDMTTISMLKDCATKKDLYRGMGVHAEIVKKNLLVKSPYVGSALVSMYAKCGALAKAQQILDELPIRDVVTWNALMAGYAQHNHNDGVFNCFEQMKKEGLSPNAVTFICFLKACSLAKAIDRGKEIYDEVVKKGLLGHVEVGNAVVYMLAKCGELDKARKVLSGLLSRNVVSWNALISGYVQKGQVEEALDCFEQMQREGISPDKITFTCILKACASTGAIEKGMRIHEEIVTKGLLAKDGLLGTALLDMYSKCSNLGKAQEVFDMLPSHDVVSWSVLISGYAQHGQGEEALNCFERMRKTGISPNEVTFTCALKACGSVGALEKGMQIHNEIITKGFLKTNIALGNALVDMYVKCRVLEKAKQVLEELPIRDVVSWSALIAGYTQQGQSEEALNFFEQMQREGLSPGVITFVSALKACGNVGAVRKGKRVHHEIINMGLLDNNIELQNSLVDMYAKCGELEKADQIFDEFAVEDLVSWNTLISACAQLWQVDKSLNYFNRMANEGLCPDIITFISILKVCNTAAMINKGKQIHSVIMGIGLLPEDPVLGTALVDMYAKIGELERAQHVFDQVVVRNVICWNALISGYTEHGKGEEALNCFACMQHDGFLPDTVTYVCMLKVCGITGAIDKGKQIHDEILRNGLLNKDIVLASALVDMYSKCGELEKAHELFGKLPIQDIVTWNSLLSGYIQWGHTQEALSCFKQMRHNKVAPDAVTFLCVLTACSHSGLLDEGLIHFESMKNYGLKPGIEHYTCMVDLLGRAGHFDKAMSVIKGMPCPDYAAWSALLGACEKWGNVKLGRLAFNQAIQLDSVNSRCYVYMINIYAEAGMPEEMEEIEAMRSRTVL